MSVAALTTATKVDKDKKRPVATRNICIEVEFGGKIVVLVLAVMEQVSERVCDDADVSRLQRFQLIQFDQVVLLSVVLRCLPRVSSATGARRRKRYLACSCTSNELVHIELVSEPVLNGAVVPSSPQSMIRPSRAALFSSQCAMRPGIGAGTSGWEIGRVLAAC